MIKDRFLKQLPMRIMYYLMPIIFFLVIWIPVIDHYYVPNTVITDTMADTARNVPSDSLLDELNGKEFNLGTKPSFENKERLILAAEKILQGNVEIPGGPPLKISIPFSSHDMNKGLPGQQLNLAIFVIPEVLLSAYQVTGRDVFFTTARDVILGWALYERNAWLPRGMLWNDHAIAARILVLSKFWRLYRNHQTYQTEVAKTILQLVARSGKLLAEPSHFTFSTNHGVMQNLALLHLCLAFPTLPDVGQYKQLALNRIHDQMTYYINDEGVILEHSAEYQKWGLQLMGMAFRYLTLMTILIPDDWREKYEKAKEIYAQLRRPDGSMPMFGDTKTIGDPLGPLVTNVDVHGRSESLNYQKSWIPKYADSLYPVAGYSIWWDGLREWPNEQKLNQTVVIWSYFPGHAHKHADEMSVLLWAGGQTWWTNVGYWTYGTKGRAEAESWNGSNAPHLSNESVNSVRNTKLLSYGWSNRLAFIDLERRGPKGYVARRQVVHMKPNLWIVVDNTYGDNNSRTTTTWTTSHNVTLSKGEFSGSYYLKGESNTVSLKTFIIASEGTEIRQYRGSFKPFAGWGVNKPASAIVIEQPSNNSWTVAIWSLESTVSPILKFTEQPYTQSWKGPEAWEIVLPVETGLLTVWREGKYIYANEGIRDESTKKVTLIEAPILTDKYTKIRAGYENAARKYPKFKALLEYRWKITYFLCFIFIMQEVFFFIYKKIKGKHHVGLRVFSMLGWAGMMGAWLLIVYFKA